MAKRQQVKNMWNKMLFVFLTFAVFATGLGIGSFVGSEFTSEALASTQVSNSKALTFETVETPQPKSADPLKAQPQEVNLQGPVERNSPQDWISQSQIEMTSDGVFIRISNPQWAIFADSNSMDPVFDAGSHAIQIIPTDKSQIAVGDILSYQSPLGFVMIHRVTEIGEDAEGWYAIVKGDNNPTPDPWKIRWDMVRRITVAVIY
jgi:hypothetical protein